MTSIKLLLALIVCTACAVCSGQRKSDNSRLTGNTVQELDNRIWVIHQDRAGNYWFGSNGNGVYRYNGQELVQFTMNHGLTDDQIRGIQENTDGDIFFDTPNGVCQYDGESFVTLDVDRSNKYAWILQPDDLWFNGNGDVTGGFRYDGETLHYLEFPASDLNHPAQEFSLSRFSDHGVYTISKDTHGNLWFGTLAAGVCRYDGERFSWIREKELLALEDGRVPAIRSIIEDRDGNYWLSHILYRYRMETTNDTLQYEKLPGIDANQGGDQMELPYYTSAVIGSDNNLWMTTYGEGVWKYDGEELSNYRLKDGTTEALPVSIYKDSEGTLWVGTDNAGVFKFDGEDFVKFKP